MEIVDPFDQVDNVLMPFTDIENRKIERLGKVQRKRYLKNRELKRQELIVQEETHQEQRLQDCYSRLFRIHLILAAQEMSPAPDSMFAEASSSRVLPSTTSKSTSRGSSKSKPNSKERRGGGRRGGNTVDATSTKNPSNSLYSTTTRGDNGNSSCSSSSNKGGDKQIIDENLLKAHISLRAAFRAFHPERMEAYANLLAYTHDVLLHLLVRTRRMSVVCSILLVPSYLSLTVTCI